MLRAVHAHGGQEGRAAVSSTLHIPASARPAWDRLTRALVDYEPPCSHDPDSWWATDPESVEVAVSGCRRCQVLRACGAYADAAGERYGVWAGTDRELRHQCKGSPR